ncbi:MAG: transcriptional regulator [candidate division NC10 bacterium]|jgi:thiaminase
MVDAGHLVEETRQELQAVETRIRRHPYLDAVEAGSLSRNELRRFAGQQHHIIGSDLRAMALLIAKAETAKAREFFWGGIQGERSALEALHAFASALAMPAEELEASEPIPGTFAYSAYVAWLALFGSCAEFAAAFLVNLEAWGGNCARMSQALRTRYQLKNGDVAFFDLFSSPPPGFQERALQVIQEGLDRGVRPQHIRRAARMLQGYELLYWDTLHQALTG